MAVHVVKYGESIWTISKQYQVPVLTIAQLNGLLSPYLIMPGLALYIPEPALPLRYYEITAGDTLYNIAARYQTTASAIVAANPGIRPENLKIGQRIDIPSPLKLNLSLLGFVIPYSPRTAIAALEAVAGQLTYVAVVAFSITREGYAYMVLNDQELVRRSRELNVTPLLMVRNIINDDFSAELIGNVLGNPVYRNNLVQSLVRLARQRGYGGVSIDFEFIPPQRRKEFTLFLSELKQELGELILHVNVHAKSEDMPTNRIVGGYDYRAIGNIADIVAVMTIDYGYPTGPPDPIAPIYWVEDVVRYAVSQINPRKLQIAVALYGYDKITGTPLTTAMSLRQAQNQAIAVKAEIQFEKTAQSPWYRYMLMNNEHIVWFEDIRSLREKYRLMDVYQLLGTTFWHIGLSAPQNWAYIREQIRVRKNL